MDPADTCKLVGIRDTWSACLTGRIGLVDALQTILDFEKNLIDKPSLKEVQGIVGIISEAKRLMGLLDGLQGSASNELACQLPASLLSASAS